MTPLTVRPIENHRYDISVVAFDNGVLVAKVDDMIGDMRLNIMHQVLDTQDQMIRSALIELGWTPPPTGPGAST